MSAVVTVQGSVGMFVLYRELLKVVGFISRCEVLCVVYLYSGCDGYCAFCLTCDACNCKCFCMGRMYRYLALLFYMSVADYPAIYLYWSTATLFHRTWARAFISSMRRFQQISSFLKVSNFENEKRDDTLCKVRFLHDYIRRKCMKLYQPDVNVSIDERMVQNKGRYSFRQYIKDKPTKWGIKIWVIADSATGWIHI